MRRRRAGLLWVSVSGRAMAQAARRGGHTLQVVDFHADLETRAAARAAPWRGDERGFQADLESFLDDWVPVRPGRAMLLPGSGFEARPELLDALGARYSLPCAYPAQLRRVRDVEGFMTLLDRLGVPRPELRPRGETGNIAAGHWLVKRRGGMGGGHVHFYRGERPPRDSYLQRYYPGRLLSLVFLAARGTLLPVGWSGWPAAVDGDFRFGGAIAWPRPPARAAAGLLEAACELSRVLELRGLCGLDAVLDREDGFRLLELNPRPPAGFELHDQGGFLFDAHLAACQANRIPRRLPRPGCSPVRALAVCYAASSGSLAPRAWPAWVRDRSRPGSRVSAGAPVCTVHASAATPAAAAWLLRRRCLGLRGLRGLRDAVVPGAPWSSSAGPGWAARVFFPCTPHVNPLKSRMSCHV